MGRKVLVFGATGEIGGRVAQLAVMAGHTVYGAARGKYENDLVDLRGVTMLKGDKMDEAFLRDVCAPIKPDVVIDTVPRLESVDLYMKYFPGVSNVLFCSSTGTFVPLQHFPANEQHPWRLETPFNFYNQCVRDDYAFRMYHEKGFPITIFRPTNIIGPGRIPLELWGSRDINFFRKLKASEPITIAPCEDVLLQSGYNWDLASAFVKAIDKPDLIRGELFIISCAKAIRLGEYLKTAMDYLGSKSEISYCPAENLKDIYPEVTMKFRMDFLLLHMCFDISKVRNVLGYQPTKTTQEGLIETLEWCERIGEL